MAVIGDCADQGQDEDLEDYREGDEVAPEGTRIDCEAERVDFAVSGDGGFGERGEVGAQEEGDYGGGKGGVAPVVGIPGPLLALLIWWIQKKVPNLFCRCGIS